MKTLIFIFIIVLLGLTLLLSQSKVYFFENVFAYEDTTEEVIRQLFYCEARNNPNAYNVKDNDGLPKYGSLQFRKETFKEQAILYKILDKTADFETLIWDKDIQFEVARKMIKDGKLYRWGCGKFISVKNDVI